MGKRAHDAALGELDFEAVFGGGMRVFQGGFGCLAEDSWAGSLAFEGVFGFEGAPGHGADPAERDAGVLDAAAVGFYDDSRGGDRELVGGTIS